MVHAPLLALAMMNDVSSECTRLSFIKEVGDHSIIEASSFIDPFQLNSTIILFYSMI